MVIQLQQRPGGPQEGLWSLDGCSEMSQTEARGADFLCLHLLTVEVECLSRGYNFGMSSTFWQRTIGDRIQLWDVISQHTQQV